MSFVIHRADQNWRQQLDPAYAAVKFFFKNLRFQAF